MVIGIDASRANRDYKTGTEWYSFYLIKNLAEIDHKNKYILYTDKPLIPSLAEVVKKHKNFKARVLRWPIENFWTLGRLSLEMLWRRPRVLFVPAHGLPLIKPRRTITTIHDVAFLKEKEVYENAPMLKTGTMFKRLINALAKHYFFLKTGKFHCSSLDYLKWSTLQAVKKAKKIITVSEFTKKEVLENYKIKPEKIAVIHNGYPDNLYKKIERSEKFQEILEKYGVPQDYLLYVGRLEKKKNIPLLLEAFAILKENHPEIKTKLLLVGAAGYGYDELKYIEEEFNLHEELLALGWVEEEDLPYIYNAATGFVFPSRHEGFGIPVIQALACGLPTLVSDLPVLKEIAEDAVLYFDKDNKMELAEKLYQLISNKNLRQELVEKGLKRAKNFSWKKCAEETLREIEKL